MESPVPPHSKKLAEGGGLDPFASALLSEVVEVLGELSGRLALIRDQGGSDGGSLAELRRMQEEVAGLQVVLSLALEEGSARPWGGEEHFALGSAVESTVDRWVPSSPRIRTTLRSSLPSGSAVHGPSSLFQRVLRGLLRSSSRMARSRLRIEMKRVGEGSTPDTPRRAEILLLHDGPLPVGEGRDPSLLVAQWGIHKLGGTLMGPETVTTEAGESVALRIRLPLAPPPSREGERVRSWRPQQGVPGPLDGVRIAVVDDEPALRSVLARLLSRAGADVLTLAPELGDPATVLARRILSEAPDLVLLDLNLGRVSGRTILELLEEHTGPAVILLTGDPTQARNLLCPVMAKPVDWPELVRRIQEVLGHR